MARYANGQVPLTALKPLGSGTNGDGYWEHRLPEGTYQRWLNLVADVKAHEGKTLQITPGWNAYRPLDAQWAAYRREGSKNAAYPGTSSHGGVFEGRDSFAVDVGNYGVIGKTKFYEYARKHGFTVNRFDWEPWHIIDYNPWVSPTVTPAANPTGKSTEEEDMTPEQDARLKAVENLLRVHGQNYGYPQATKQDTEDIRSRIYVRDENGNPKWDVFQDIINRLAAIESKLK